MPNENVFHVVLDANANIIVFEGLASSISGYEPSEVIGKNWFKVFIPDSNLEEITTVFNSFFSGDINFWEYENHITCKDGSTCLIKWQNILLRDSKNIPIKISSQGTL